MEKVEICSLWAERFFLKHRSELLPLEGVVRCTLRLTLLLTMPKPLVQSMTAWVFQNLELRIWTFLSLFSWILLGENRDSTKPLLCLRPGNYRNTNNVFNLCGVKENSSLFLQFIISPKWKEGEIRGNRMFRKGQGSPFWDGFQDVEVHQWQSCSPVCCRRSWWLRRGKDK